MNYIRNLLINNQFVLKDTNNIDRFRVKVIGFGNKFLSDDGIGPIVIEELEKTGHLPVRRY